MLTDVVMPEFSGPQLAATAQECRQKMNIRFVSGCVAEEYQSQLPVGVAVLFKPFTRQELLAFVAEAIVQPALVPARTGPPA